MLHIVKQFMSALTMGLKLGLDKPSGNWEVLNTQDKVNISKLLSTLDINNDEKLDNTELAIKLSDNSDLKDFLSKLWVTNLENNPALWDIISSLENFQWEVQKVRDITNNSLKKLNISVAEFKSEKSGKHYHDKAKDSFWNYENPEEFLEDVNHNAAKILFSEHKASEILKIIQDHVDSKEVQEPILGPDGKPIQYPDWTNKTKTVTEYTFDGSSEAEDMLIDLWYAADGIFGADELHGLWIMAKNLSKNEAMAKKANDEELFKMLSDFDSNGVLETYKNFYMWELQSLYLWSEDNLAWSYANLFDNIWMSDIKQKLSDNFYATEQEFQLKISTLLQNKVKPAELFSAWGLEKSVTEMYKNDMEALKNFSDTDKTYIKSQVEAKLSEITGWKVPNLGHEAELITLQSLTAIAGGAEWLAVWFDITKLTQNIIDNLALGFVWGNFGIILSKNFYKENDISVTGSLLNFHVPILTVSYDMIKADIDKNDLVYPELSETQTTAYASISTLGKAVWVQLNSVENDTQLWIETMWSTLKTQLVEMIDALKADIDWKNPIQIVDTEGNPDTKKQKYYDQYFSILKNIAVINNHVLVLENTANSMVSSYKDEMYRNAERNDWNFSSVWAGVIFASDILPLPYITAAYEDFTTQFNTVDHSYERERQVTEVTAKEKLQIETYNDKRVISLPNEYQISVPANYNLQSEVVGNTIKIGGNIESIIIHEHVTQTWVVKTLVINWGATHENGLYIPTLGWEKITTHISLPEGTNEISSQLDEAIESTKQTRELINKLFSQETLKHPETIWAVALQKEIFKTLNNNFASEEHKSMSLNSRFNELKILVDNYLTPKYLQEIWAKEEELATLKDLLKTGWSLPMLEKQAILQSVQSNFMEKNALVVWDKNIVTLEWYRTIADYDSTNKRWAFFDEIFNREYGQEFASQITQAREEWLTANETSPNYTFTPSTGSLALTGVKLWSLSKASTPENTWVMAYEWVYNLAKVEWWKDKIPLDKNEAFVNNLPDSFLENVKNQLEWEWIELKDLQAVKKIINEWGSNWVVIDYQISFARMWECLNDAIILDSFTIAGENKEFNRSVTSTMNVQDTDVDNVWIAIVDHVRMESDNTATTPTTDPEEPGITDPVPEGDVKTETTTNGNNNVSDTNADSWWFNAGLNTTETSVNPETPVDDWGFKWSTIDIKDFNNKKIAEGVATAHKHITNTDKYEEK